MMFPFKMLFISRMFTDFKFSKQILHFLNCSNIMLNLLELAYLLCKAFLPKSKNAQSSLHL